MEGTELSKNDEVVVEIDTEAERNLAEAEKLRHEARRAAADAEIRELELKWKQDEDRERERGKPLRGGAYVFNSEVNDYSIERLLSHLSQVHKADSEAPMDIIVNSPGGSVFAGNEAMDTIYNYSLRGGGKHKVTMTVRGMAASMGGIMLQIADERVMGAQSFCLIHEVASMAIGKVGDLKDEIELLDKMSSRVVDLFVERSGGKITKKKFLELSKRKDWWLSADECLKFGFVDRIG